MSKELSPPLKLKSIAEEIKDVFRKHDIAGAVVLHLPGYAEHFIHVNPSYSCCYMYNDHEVRFYSKAVDFKSPDEQMQKNADTANMLRLLTDCTAFNFGTLQYLSETCDDITGAEHGKGTYTPPGD